MGRTASTSNGGSRQYAGADSQSRRHKVLKAISQAQQVGGDLSVSAVARQAAVDRSFLYRHRDLLEQLHRAQAAGPANSVASVSRASLQADLANAHERSGRLHSRLRLLAKRLSELMGEQAWKESGLGAPIDAETLQRTISSLEQNNAEVLGQLEDRGRDLAAARAASRELMIELNSA